jgi:NADPH:quinone reductase-like Zn-dependent oxidoreductase
MSLGGKKKLGTMGIAKVIQSDLVFLGELLEAGNLKPVIDRTFSLDETREAIRYVEETHAQGKVVITI